MRVEMSAPLGRFSIIRKGELKMLIRLLNNPEKVVDNFLRIEMNLLLPNFLTKDF